MLAQKDLLSQCGRDVEDRHPNDMKEELLHENNLAQVWLGDIKKAFQKEQKRLKAEGVVVRMKPVWQTIHDGIFAAQQRRDKLKTRPNQPSKE